jgi:voltage-dependent potassium channel beta subunit
MEYRSVGNTGLQVSAISIGGWLTFGKSVGQAASHEILAKAIERGVNFIDVADIYAKGESERVVGAMLRDYRRSDLVISSKVFWPMSDNVNDRGLSRKHIFESVHASLRRLQTDYLDLYFCHRFDPNTPLEETVRAMDDLVRQGKVLYWGTSMWSVEQLEMAHLIADRFNAYRPVVEQPRYNLIHREIEGGVMPTADRLGMGLVVWSPLAQGLLTGKYNDGVPEGSRGAESDWLKGDLTEKNLRRVKVFCKLAADAGMKPEQLALAWLLTRPEVSSAIIGATRVEQLLSNLGAVELELDGELVGKLDALFEAPAPREELP